MELMNIRTMLEAMPQHDKNILRRRIEDAIRKNPSVLLEVAVQMVSADCIRWRDLVSE